MAGTAKCQKEGVMEVPIITSEPRIVCHFSCGAASAVASKLAIVKYGHERVHIINAFIVEEHEDNRRFLADVERWLSHPITVLRDEKYGASTLEVYRRERYIKGPHGAPCATHLKRAVLNAYCLPDDVHVIGFTAEEEDRMEELQQSGKTVECPLIDKNLSKADCLGMIVGAGIELPAMYKLGFNNANCMGCPKGGSGYFNLTRIRFPEHFYALAQIQQEIGPGANFLQGDRSKRERVSLFELSPNAGRHKEPEISCSFFCDMAEREIEDATVVQPHTNK